MQNQIVSEEEQIRELTLAALAKGKAPDYSGCNPATVERAFRAIFGPGLAQPWFEYAAASIQLDSQGGITLRKAEASRFPEKIRGEAAYLELIMRDGSSKLFTMGPYRNPISFV